VFDQSVSRKAIVNSDCEGQNMLPSLDRESSQKREDSLPKTRNVMKRIAIYALVVGLISIHRLHGVNKRPVQPHHRGQSPKTPREGFCIGCCDANNPIAR